MSELNDNLQKARMALGDARLPISYSQELIDKHTRCLHICWNRSVPEAREAFLFDANEANNGLIEPL